MCVCLCAPTVVVVTLLGMKGRESDAGKNVCVCVCWCVCVYMSIYLEHIVGEHIELLLLLSLHIDPSLEASQIINTGTGHKVADGLAGHLCVCVCVCVCVARGELVCRH